MTNCAVSASSPISICADERAAGGEGPRIAKHRVRSLCLCCSSVVGQRPVRALAWAIRRAFQPHEGFTMGRWETTERLAFSALRRD